MKIPAALALLALVCVAPVAMAEETDTTVTVKSGTRLVIDNFSGDITTKTWSRNAVRVQAHHSRRTRVRIHQGTGVMELTADSRTAGPATVDYELTVPASMALNFSGVNTSVAVGGNHKGAVKIETVNGYVDVSGGAGEVEISSVNGPVTLNGASGRINVSAVNEYIHVTNSTGELSIDGVNGDIVIEGVTAKLVEASTVQGSLFYAGSIQNDGEYSFSTHQGDVTIGLPEKAAASVSVATYGGDFSSFFPVEISQSKHGRKGQRFSFTTGGGGAQIELNAFQGSIRIERAETVRQMARKMLSNPRDEDDDHDHDEDDDEDKKGHKGDK